MSDQYLEEMERRDRADYLEYLRQLVDNGDVTNKAAVGITKLVIDKGEDALSGPQTFVFQKEVREKFPQPRCEQCEELIPWSEAYEHVHSPGRCAGCQHSYEKFMQR